MSLTYIPWQPAIINWNVLGNNLFPVQFCQVFVLVCRFGVTAMLMMACSFVATATVMATATALMAVCVILWQQLQ